MKEYKNIISLLVLIILIIASGSRGVYANTQTTDLIRIGLESRYNNASSVGIANNSIIIGYDNGNGFEPSLRVTSSQGFNIWVDNNYYLDTNERFSDHQSARNRVEAIDDSNAMIALLDTNVFAIYFGGYSTEAEAIEALHLNPNATSVVARSNNRTLLMAGEIPLIVFDSATRHAQIIDGDGGFITLGGRSYRGIMEVGRQVGSGITPVNILDVEEYLYSVIPSEMPASWPMEALRAQAVAARSYTFARRGSHSRFGYELCDTVFSQVYSGVGNEHPSSTEAVRSTRGLKMFHNGNVITATYFSSSGGVTENSENVWLNATPYLRSVEDTFETMGMVWERTFTMDELTSITRANSVDIGNVTGVSIAERAESGRVNQLLITGANGSHSIRSEQIRTFFSHSRDGSLHSRNFDITSTSGSADNTTDVIGSENAPPNAGNIVVDSISDPAVTSEIIHILYAYGTAQRPVTSSFVLNSRGEIVHINDSDIVIQGTSQNMSGFSLTSADIEVYSRAVDSVTFSGRGWGHGVGMSQFGARGMAEAGFNFRDILMHYYTGIQIKVR